MVESKHEDWLGVVYGSGGSGGPAAAGSATEINVRQSPAVVDPTRAPGGEQRVRITVVPSDGGVDWSLYLRDFGEAPSTRVSWRLDPGTWQPLVGTRQCVVQGRGRVRLDVELRVNPAEPGQAPPRLRFVAEAG